MLTRKKRVTPWRTFTVGQGNALQISGLLGAVAATRHAGQLGARGGTHWMVAGRVLAYFTEHAFSHWVVGRAAGIRFTGYGLHGTSHPQVYPPGVRQVFSCLPLLSARTETESLRAAPPRARAAMYAAGTVNSVLSGVLIPIYCLRRDVPHAQSLLVVSGGLINAMMLLSESLRVGGDLHQAYRALRDERGTHVGVPTGPPQ